MGADKCLLLVGVCPLLGGKNIVGGLAPSFDITRESHRGESGFLKEEKSVREPGKNHSTPSHNPDFAENHVALTSVLKTRSMSLTILRTSSVFRSSFSLMCWR